MIKHLFFLFWLGYCASFLIADESILQLQSPPNSITFQNPNGYNPISRVSQTEQHTFTIEKITELPSSTAYFITATPASTSGYRHAVSGGNYVEYQLYSSSQLGDNRIIYAKDNLNSSNGGSFNNNHTIRGTVSTDPVQDSFFIDVPDSAHNQSIPPGVYTETVTFELWRGNASSNVSPSRRNQVQNITFSIPVQEVSEVDIFFEDGSQLTKSGTLSFGALEANTQISTRIRYVSNVRTNLYIKSQNGSKLIHTERPSQFVSYSIRVGSTTLPALSPNTNYQFLNNTSAKPNGSGPVVQFTLPSSIPYVSAGTYRDVITVTIETL